MAAVPAGGPRGRQGVAAVIAQHKSPQREVLPQVQEMTSQAFLRYTRLGAGEASDQERQGIVRDWVRSVSSLGAEIKVPTHRGPAVTVRIPAGTPNGQVFRVPGRGVRRKDGTLGALLATVEVTIPQDLSNKAKSALEDLRIATAGADPREELLRRARQQQ